MTMILKSYLAGKGDSFLLTWGNESDLHSLLVDSGTPGTYRFIKDDLRKSKSLNAVIATHVDYDHIGGFLKLFADDELYLKKPFQVYLNTPSLIILSPEDDKVALEHGITLDKLLHEKCIVADGLFCGFSKDNTIEIEGLSIKVVSPTADILKDLIEKWTAHKLYVKYELETKSSDKIGNPAKDKASYKEIINEPDIVHNWESDLVNSSSIAFIASYSGQSILFLGDANPDVVYEQLSECGWSITNKLSVNLVKLSHHGSKHNSSKKLLSIIDCKSFYISTDGTASYYHPDRETIIRIAEYSRSGVDESINIYSNYDIDKHRVLTDEEGEKLNINFIHQTIFSFK